jgi:hypothetical protein
MAGVASWGQMVQGSRVRGSKGAGEKAIETSMTHSSGKECPRRRVERQAVRVIEVSSRAGPMKLSGGQYTWSGESAPRITFQASSVGVEDGDGVEYLKPRDDAVVEAARTSIPVSPQQHSSGTVVHEIVSFHSC